MMGFVKKTSGKKVSKLQGQLIDKDVASAENAEKAAKTGVKGGTGGNGDSSAGSQHPSKSGVMSFHGIRNILPKNIMHWKKEFFIIVTSKAFGSGNQIEAEEVDKSIVTESEVPPWFDLDTLYLFNFDNDQDDSEARKKYSGKEILHVESVEDSSFKGKYNFVLEISSKIYFCGVEYCQDLNRWLSALRKAKSNSEEMARYKNPSKMRNIDHFINLLKIKSYDSLEEEATKDFNKAVQKFADQEDTPQRFIKILDESQNSLSVVRIKVYRRL